MKWLRRYPIVLSAIFCFLSLEKTEAAGFISNKRLVTWNVNSLKEVFTPLPSHDFSGSFCVWQNQDHKLWPLLLIASSHDSKQSVFDPDEVKEVEVLELGAILQLASIEHDNKHYVVGLNREGKDFTWIDPSRQEDKKVIHIPVYYPLKRVAFYQSPHSLKLYVFGINALGTVLTQLEFDTQKAELVPIRAFDLQEDFFERAVDIICDDESSRVYVVGERGRLACWDAEPNSSTKPILFLQNPAVLDEGANNDPKLYPSSQQRWMLLKTTPNKNSRQDIGSIGLIERTSMKVMLWARGLDNPKPSRVLALVGCKELVSIDGSYENAIIGLDLEGRICLFDNRDFLLAK